MEVAKRRLELLKLEGLGLSQAEIVEQLSKKNGCAQRTIYNDFEIAQIGSTSYRASPNPTMYYSK